MGTMMGVTDDASDIVFHVNGERHVISPSDVTLSLNDYIRRKTRFTVRSRFAVLPVLLSAVLEKQQTTL